MESLGELRDRHSTSVQTQDLCRVIPGVFYVLEFDGIPAGSASPIVLLPFCISAIDRHRYWGFAHQKFSGQGTRVAGVPVKAPLIVSVGVLLQLGM